MKSLVVAKHALGPAENGHDFCYGRARNSGLCPGHQLAEWLNALGDDDEPYYNGRVQDASGRQVTNLMVRHNWVRHSQHLYFKEERRAELGYKIQRLTADLHILLSEQGALDGTGPLQYGVYWDTGTNEGEPNWRVVNSYADARGIYESLCEQESPVYGQPHNIVLVQILDGAHRVE